jgi:hypothetical protein
MGQGGLGKDGAAAHHPPEAGVGRHLPVDRHRPGRHPAVGQQRLGRQPSPQHHPTGRRVPGGDPEGERIPPPLGRGRPGAGQPVGDQHGRDGTARAQKAAAVDHTSVHGGHSS